jgi:hypothetical protein
VLECTRRSVSEQERLMALVTVFFRRRRDIMTCSKVKVSRPHPPSRSKGKPSKKTAGTRWFLAWLTLICPEDGSSILLRNISVP